MFLNLCIPPHPCLAFRPLNSSNSKDDKEAATHTRPTAGPSSEPKAWELVTPLSPLQTYSPARLHVWEADVHGLLHPRSLVFCLVGFNQRKAPGENRNGRRSDRLGCSFLWLSPSVPVWSLLAYRGSQLLQTILSLQPQVWAGPSCRSR